MLACIASAALAADWPVIQGTELGRPDTAAQPFGFVQLVGEAVRAETVTGLTSAALAPYEGQRPSADRVGPGDAAAGFSVRRARLGLRGSVPATEQRVGWLLSVEAGSNAATRVAPVVLSDASVTVSPTDGLHLRAGRFKLPLSDEALEGNPVAATSIDFTAATAQLLQENPVRGGAYVGGGSAFRDVGLSVFGDQALGPLVLSANGVVANGSAGGWDLDDGKDLAARLALTHVFGGEAWDPHRREVSAYAWAQRGSRALESGPAVRLREGAGLDLETASVRLRAEAVRAVGAVEVPAAFPGLPVEVHADGRAWGAAAWVHGTWRWLGGTVRGDLLDRDTQDPAALRTFRTLTLGVDAVAAKRVRVQVDYAFRRADAPQGSPDARRIARATGDRVAAQLGVVF